MAWLVRTTASYSHQQGFTSGLVGVVGWFDCRHLAQPLEKLPRLQGRLNRHRGSSSFCWFSNEDSTVVMNAANIVAFTGLTGQAKMSKLAEDI